jgi:hypothetical protein
MERIPGGEEMKQKLDKLMLNTLLNAGKPKFKVGDIVEYGVNTLEVLFVKESYYCCQSLATGAYYAIFKDKWKDLKLKEVKNGA